MPDHRFTIGEQELNGKGSGRRKIGKDDYQAEGVMHVPAEARFSHLLSLPEGEIIELYHGRIYDPACGSGDMFAQSSEFIKAPHLQGARRAMVGTAADSSTVFRAPASAV